MSRLVLASSSPRRIALLRNLGVDFEVVEPGFEEKMEGLEREPGQLALELAQGKAMRAAKRLENKVVIGCDTIVVKDDNVLGKPSGFEEACRMLRSLSGGPHRVITGVAIVDSTTWVQNLALEETTVYFRQLEDWEILYYVKSGEPFDKAGGYGIQGLGSLLVDRIAGCYYNVVGLPLSLLYKMLQAFGINLLTGENRQ